MYLFLTISLCNYYFMYLCNQNYKPPPHFPGVWPPYSSYLSIEIAESSVDSSSKFVRAIYNDKEMVIVGSVGGSVWCPYELFHSRLEEMSMTHSEYAESCSTCAVDGGVLVDDDIKATMGEK